MNLTWCKDLIKKDIHRLEMRKSEVYEETGEELKEIMRQIDWQIKERREGLKLIKRLEKIENNTKDIYEWLHKELDMLLEYKLHQSSPTTIRTFIEYTSNEVRRKIFSLFKG